MARAAKCDVCGKYFDQVKCNPPIQVIVEYGYKPSHRMDICKECEMKLAEMFHLTDNVNDAINITYD